MKHGYRCNSTFRIFVPLYTPFGDVSTGFGGGAEGSVRDIRGKSSPFISTSHEIGVETINLKAKR